MNKKKEFWSCIRKRNYKTKQDAENAIRCLQEKFGSHKLYYCECGYYHLASLKKTDNIKTLTIEYPCNGIRQIKLTKFKIFSKKGKVKIKFDCKFCNISHVIDI